VVSDSPDDLSDDGPALLREGLLRARSSLGAATPPPIEAFLSPAEGPGEIGRLAHYRVVRLLGEGAMGRVYEAEDTRLFRPVALKILLPIHGSDGAVRERFLREARALAQLNHPHVVAVFDVGIARTTDGTADLPYLAMQLLPGETLESALLRRGRLSEAEAVRVGRETAEGLAAVHDKGLVHRDVKPSNLWLESPAGAVKILDFGLARPASGEGVVSNANQMIGTPAFMSPEQARGDPLDGRADLFALGCILYTAVAGELPFDGPTVMAVLTRLAVHDPPPLSRRVPGTSPALSALVRELLAKEPAERPPSARVVAARLRRIENEPAVFGGPTLTTQRAPTDGEIPVPPPKPPTRRRLFALAGLAGLGGLGAVAWWWNTRGVPSGPPIKVGVLHSATGTMSASEVPVLEMTQLALEELNAAGGLLGRPVEAVLGDGASKEAVFAKQAERLVSDGVVALFGCWTSASRKAVMEVVERRRHLLFYPVQYEGLEESPRIVYTGAAPNQQLLPAADWCVRRQGKRTFFLVGSDYIFPHAANALLRHRIGELVGPEAVVGEEYVPLGSDDMARVVTAIQAAKPDAILNTINGSSNAAFFRALRAARIAPQQTLTVSFSLDEESIRRFEPVLVAGTYAAWGYFSSLDNPVNAAFKARYHDRWGKFKAVTDPMEAAWLGVQFWAQAVRTCGRPDDLDAVLRCVGDAAVDAPQGPDVRVDADNRHTWRYFRVARVTPTAEMRVVYEDAAPTRPEPFPAYRTREEWHAWQQELFRKWGDRWSAPGEE